jgi:hypothetical protein
VVRFHTCSPSFCRKKPPPLRQTGDNVSARA